MRGTIELNSDKVKVFLPELMCDFFIGVVKPNQMTIDKDSYGILSKDNRGTRINSRAFFINWELIIYKDNQ
tara:strand:+ start:656 stop:868 length:213 start_codon:yes stop_codon:yes gene_type:complete